MTSFQDKIQQRVNELVEAVNKEKQIQKNKELDKKVAINLRVKHLTDWLNTIGANFELVDVTYSEGEYNLYDFRVHLKVEGYEITFKSEPGLYWNDTKNIWCWDNPKSENWRYVKNSVSIQITSEEALEKVLIDKIAQYQFDLADFDSNTEEGSPFDELDLPTEQEIKGLNSSQVKNKKPKSFSNIFY